MKKITDKMRLDWLLMSGNDGMACVRAGWGMEQVFNRRAIDAAIRASRKRGKR